MEKSKNLKILPTCLGTKGSKKKKENLQATSHCSRRSDSRQNELTGNSEAYNEAWLGETKGKDIGTWRRGAKKPRSSEESNSKVSTRNGISEGKIAGILCPKPKQKLKKDIS